MARKASNKEYEVIVTLTDRSSGATKRLDELTPEEKQRAGVIMGMRALKSYYGANAEITLTNPQAAELYGVKSI